MVFTVFPLEVLCLQRIEQDIVRHAVKWKAEVDKETSIYRTFRMMYEYILPFYLPEKDESSRNGMSPATYIDTVNFVLTPYLESFTLCQRSNEWITTALANNCKNLKELSVYLDSSSWDMNINFLKSMKLLVSLTLYSCSFQSVRTVKAIADALVHLRTLSLENTNIDDNGVFVLCGHESPPSDSTTECSFAKNCSVTCKLKLVSLTIRNSNLSRVALACAVTHIPTLKSLVCFSLSHNIPLLSDVITSISEQRRTLNEPILKFQLEDVGFIWDSRGLKACLESCPKLVTLNFLFQNNNTAGRLPEKYELSSLEDLNIKCTSVNQIFFQELESLWTKNGPQIKNLNISSPSEEERVEADLDVIKNILALCPKLVFLDLRNLEVRSAVAKDVLLQEYPVLQDLTDIQIDACGETALVNVFAYKLIVSGRNVRRLFLRFLISEIIFPYITERYLPLLNGLYVKFNLIGQPVKEMQRFFDREKSKLKICPI